MRESYRSSSRIAKLGAPVLFALALLVVAPQALAASDTIILTAPQGPTNNSTANFTYIALPDDPGTTFECKLDAEAFAPCPEAGEGYAGLADGSHTFMVRAIAGGEPDLTPDTHTWTIDTDPPETTITGAPPNPNDGRSVSFSYRSDEPTSTFRCQLDTGAIQSCAAAGQSYAALLDGPHVFRVWASDNAANQDPAPAEYAFTVRASLADVTPPDTLILLAPRSPSDSSSAFFAYTSNEATSRFECRLDAAAFAPCPATGISYAGLKNGPHAFAVRAIDAGGNVDPVAATFAWAVAGPTPSTRITKPPPRRILAKSSKRKVKVTIAFATETPGSSFRCRVDRKAFKRCPSKVSIRVGPGRHRFEVYAVDTLGNADASPARSSFRVLRK